MRFIILFVYVAIAASSAALLSPSDLRILPTQNPTVAPTCGQPLTLAKDTNYLLKSNNYPQPYDNSASCEYTFTVPAGHSLAVKCQGFTVGVADEGCSGDALAFDGDVLSGRFCGKALQNKKFELDARAVEWMINVNFEAGVAGGDKGFLCRLAAIEQKCPVSTEEPTTTATPVAARRPRKSLQHVLWLGNSYTYFNDVPMMVWHLADKTDGVKMIYKKITKGGASFESHYKDASVKNMIASNVFDVVILQEQSQRGSFDEGNVCYFGDSWLNGLVSSIRAKSGADTPIQFFQTWGRPHSDAGNCAWLPSSCAFGTMQDRITRSYDGYACAYQPAQVAPVGEAFRLIKEKDGDEKFLGMYNKNGGDHHQSLKGSYLAACLHFTALFDLPCTGSVYRPSDISSADALWIQQRADETFESRNWEFGADCKDCFCGKGSC